MKVRWTDWANDGVTREIKRTGTINQLFRIVLLCMSLYAECRLVWIEDVHEMLWGLFISEDA